MSAVDPDLATRRYLRAPGEVHVKLLPKQYFVTDQPLVLTTVLGSCVAVCLRDAIAGVAGMNHFMLPEAVSLADPTSESMVYGRCATERLLGALVALGAKRARLTAKLFGGAHVIEDMRQMRVGDANAAFARAYLAAAGIPIQAEDLGGTWPRQVHFHAANGVARVRRLGRNETSVAAREQALIGAVTDARRGLRA